MKKIGLFFCWLMAGVFATTFAQGPQNTVKTATGANDPTAHAYLAKAAKWASSASALELRFDACAATAQTLSNPKNCQRGSILMQGKNFKLILGTRTYYCNGENLWDYVPQNKEVSVYAYTEDMSQINPMEILKNYKKFYRAKYIRQETLSGSARNIIDLTPIERSEILKIRLFINQSDFKPFRMEIYYSQDNIYIYSITESKAVSAVNASEFVFNPRLHPEVEVNDMR